jgi:outer membrane protein OmpA-like peptidoglycan-associated protein
MTGAPASEPGGAGLGSALTDLMTSLAVLFVLLLVASLHNAHQEAADLRQEVREALKRALAGGAPGEAGTITVADDPRDPLGLVVVVPEQLFQFPFASARVPPAGQAFLEGFAPRLAGTVCSDRFRPALASVVVEGHTDTAGSDAVNLELSQRRSLAVVGELLAVLRAAAPSGAAPAEEACLLDLLAASGRGRREPLRAESGAVDPGRSRRVVFKVRVKSIEQRALARALTGPPAAAGPGVR